jgi:hypothetical protein
MQSGTQVASFALGLLVASLFFLLFVGLHNPMAITAFPVQRDNITLQKPLDAESLKYVSEMLKSLATQFDSESLLLAQNQKEPSSSSRAITSTTPSPGKQDINGSTRPVHYRCGPRDDNIQAFRKLALSQPHVTDKVTTHSYHTMYGIFLTGLKDMPIKMLEIGLGCGMSYGPGASVKVWKNYLHPNSEIWMAEQNAECIEKHKNEKSMEGIKTVTGDQSDPETLKRWVQETGGSFDVVIDDGGHMNVQIKRSFDVLWPTVKPGGMYFIEDLQVGRGKITRKRGFPQNYLEQGKSMGDVLESWMENLLIPWGGLLQGAAFQPPPGLQSIYCQREACVLFKEP